VVDLTTYRNSKVQPQADPALPQPDAEETITEIAKYVLLIVQAIKRPRH
jgi:hypothetical protein